MSSQIKQFLRDPCTHPTDWGEYSAAMNPQKLDYSDFESNISPSDYPEHSSAEELVSKLELLFRVKQLEQEVEELKKAAFSQSYTILITSLGVPELNVLKPIPVTIRKDGDDDFIASFFDANISTGGSTEQEAIYNLQGLITDIFEMHENETSELGPAMIVQKQVLDDVLCRTSQKIMR